MRDTAAATGLVPPPARCSPGREQGTSIGKLSAELRDRAHLSRIVAACLYQLFPKLGLTSHAALRDALAARLAEPKSDD